MGKLNNALRMLAILRSREKVTRKELSEELEVSEREITRYKDDLEYAGVNITTISGRYGGYRLEHKDYLLNLDLSDNELIALKRSIDILRMQGVHFYSDLQLAIEKINASKRSIDNNEFNEKSYNEKINNEKNYYAKGVKLRADVREESNKWLTINDGIINSRKIIITYMNASGETSERVIHPYGLFTYYGANFFVGYCENKKELRRFKLIRIKSIELLKDKFNKIDFSLEEYLKDDIGVYSDRGMDVILKITYPYAQGFKEFQWVEQESIEDCINEGFIIYKAKISGKIQAINWIMGMGDNCEVIAPNSLREEVKECIRKTLRKYEE